MSDNGGGEQQITRGGPQFWDFSPVWSPDTRFVYYAERDAAAPALPWIMSLDHERRNTQKGARLGLGLPSVEGPQISADGLWLLFEGMGPDENREVFVSTLTGELRTRLTSDPDLDFDPVWRPASPE